MDETKTCEHCGTVFGRQRQASGQLYDLARFKRRRFCSYECAKPHQKTPMPAADRFAKYVQKGEPDECWPWTGRIGSKGYGTYKVGKKRGGSAHRLAWELHNGPIPDSLWVLHRCDNRPCCNPNHLFLGTNADNVQDMIDKGRGGVIHVVYQGERIHLSEAARRAGLHPTVPAGRRLRGWPEELWFAPIGTRWPPRTPAPPPKAPARKPTVTYKGEEVPFAEACRRASVSSDKARSRKRRGLPETEWFKPDDHRTNRRSVIHDGQPLSLAEAAAKLGGTASALCWRRKNGWRDEDLLKPVRPKKPNGTHAGGSDPTRRYVPHRDF